VPISSPEPDPLEPPDGSLRELARRAIASGLASGRAPEVEAARFAPALRELRSSFVTLRCEGELRGCMGTLEARLPLVCDVVRNAWRAAFADPRFPPLCAAELPGTEIRVSVLSPLAPLDARSERELLARLRPGIDGLVLRDGPHVATFLPSVWESLREPREFLDQLRQKAGLAPGHWSETLRFERYTSSDWE
jgi:uncharacterized protein